MNLLSIMQKHHYSIGKQFAVADCTGEKAAERESSPTQPNSRYGDFKEPLVSRDMVTGSDPMKQATSYAGWNVGTFEEPAGGVKNKPKERAHLSRRTSVLNILPK